MVCKQEQLQAWCNFAVTAEPKSIEPDESFSDVEARIRHEKCFGGMSGAGKAVGLLQTQVLFVDEPAA